MRLLSRLLLSSTFCLLLVPAAAQAKDSEVNYTPSGARYPEESQQDASMLHNNRAVELGNKGLWTEAIKEHELALSLQAANKDFRSNLSAAYLRYGNQLFRSCQYHEAIHQFRCALFVDPDNRPAGERLDECCKKLGKDPKDISYLRSQAKELETADQLEDAIVEYRNVLQVEDTGKSHADLGFVLLKASKPVDAYRELCMAVRKQWNKDDASQLAEVHRTLAEILTKYAYVARDRGSGSIAMRRLQNAVTEYRRAVTLNPNDTEAIRGFIETAREASVLKPSFDNYLLLGGAYLLAHDFAHSNACYEQCYKIDSKRAELTQARMAYHQAVANKGNGSVATETDDMSGFAVGQPAVSMLSKRVNLTKAHNQKGLALMFTDHPRTDVTLIAISADEPMPQQGFPPLPCLVQLPVGDTKPIGNFLNLPTHTKKRKFPNNVNRTQLEEFIRGKSDTLDGYDARVPVRVRFPK